MKILFAYFGKPRFVCSTMPNHITVMKKLQQDMVDHGGADIDILFATTPMDDDTIKTTENIISAGITPIFDFISEFERASIAESIHSKLKSNYFSMHQILMLYYQIISIHMLSKKVKKEYDAIYILRTDILFTIHGEDFNFSFLPYFINRSDLNNTIFVTHMNHHISPKMPPIVVDDRILLTNNIPLKDLYVENFQENAAAYLDDSYTRWEQDALGTILNYHAICLGFLSNNFNSKKLKLSGRMYKVDQHLIVPRNGTIRYVYNDVENMNDLILSKIQYDTVQYDLNNNKFSNLLQDLLAGKK